MWISEQESETVASTLFPKMKKTKQEHEDLLYEAVTLEVCNRSISLYSGYSASLRSSTVSKGSALLPVVQLEMK